MMGLCEGDRVHGVRHAMIASSTLLCSHHHLECGALADTAPSILMVDHLFLAGQLHCMIPLEWMTFWT